MNSTPAPRSAVSQAQGRFGPLDILLFAAWCALASGELEVACGSSTDVSARPTAFT